MGLDAVELVMAFEEHFGVELSAAEAAKLFTPGMVIDFICTQLTLAVGKTCQSQKAFYRLRRAVIKVLGRKRQELSPHTRLLDLVDGPDCSGWWGRLKEEVQAREWPAFFS